MWLHVPPCPSHFPPVLWDAAQLMNHAFFLKSFVCPTKIVAVCTCVLLLSSIPRRWQYRLQCPNPKRHAIQLSSQLSGVRLFCNVLQGTSGSVAPNYRCGYATVRRLPTPFCGRPVLGGVTGCNAGVKDGLMDALAGQRSCALRPTNI